MADNLRVALRNLFSQKETFLFWLKFHWKGSIVIKSISIDSSKNLVANRLIEYFQWTRELEFTSVPCRIRHPKILTVYGHLVDYPDMSALKFIPDMR